MQARALVNANVLPMTVPGPGWATEAEDGSKPWEAAAEAILWDRDRILLVGTTGQVGAEARRRGIHVEDLDGRTVIPGFVDAHMHFLHAGVKKTRPDLGGCRSLAEAMERLAQWLAAHPGASPVIGELWDESGWSPRARPHRTDLDQVAQAAARAGHGPADRPIVLRRVCGHVAIASTAALPAIRKRWDDDALVDLETGVLLEQPSLYLNEVIPVPPADLDKALALACRMAHQLGVTALGDYSQAPYRAALLRAAAAETLSVRVHSNIYVQQLEDEIQAGFATKRASPGQGSAASPWLRDGGLKVFLDGSLGARSAALREAYLDAPKDMPSDCGGQRAKDRQDLLSRFGCVGHPHPQGTLNWSDKDVQRLFSRAHDAGIQLHAHAIGDAAIDQGLAYFAKLAARGDVEGRGWNGNALRHRFEHYEIAHSEQISKTAELRIVSSSQPNFVGTWSSKGGMYHDRLGERFRLNNRFRAMKEAGIHIAFGSDGMPFGPLVGLQAAVEHPEPDQRMGPREAIWHYTAAAAWSLHWEDEVGSLAPGRFADLVVLDATASQLEKRPPSRWRVLETIAGGRSRYTDPGLRERARAVV
ncbi:MAG TPA: amidohydrolase [Candidatus Thermoplasmatota archaeon]|nr:amidohydrolase [Candidatus Thermoplasmatota archaeon]